MVLSEQQSLELPVPVEAPVVTLVVVVLVVLVVAPLLVVVVVVPLLDDVAAAPQAWQTVFASPTQYVSHPPEQQ